MNAQLEEDILHRAQAHDEDAINTLLESYAPVVFSYFRHMGLETRVAEDLAQDTFRAVWKALPGFQGNSSLKTWILSIGRRIAFHHFRREKKKVSLVQLPESSEYSGHLFDGEQLAPEQAFLQAERQYTLEMMLETLPHDEREVVVLHGLEELSQREVAALMGRSVGWVNKIWKRACVNIKKKLLKVYPTSTPTEILTDGLFGWRPQKTLIAGM